VARDRRGDRIAEQAATIAEQAATIVELRAMGTRSRATRRVDHPHRVGPRPLQAAQPLSRHVHVATIMLPSEVVVGTRMRARYQVTSDTRRPSVKRSIVGLNITRSRDVKMNSPPCSEQPHSIVIAKDSPRASLRSSAVASRSNDFSSSETVVPSSSSDVTSSAPSSTPRQSARRRCRRIVPTAVFSQKISSNPASTDIFYL